MSAAVLCTTGCFLGGQSTDDMGRCDSATTPLATDDTVGPETGLAPASVLEWALRDETLTAEWRSPPDAIETNSQPGDVALTLSLQRREGQAAEITGCMAARLEVPVQVLLTTEDGLLSESAEGSLRARTTDFAMVEAELDALQGGLTGRAGSPNVALLDWTFAVAVTRHGAAGSLGIGWETVTSGSRSMARSGAPLFGFPAGSACPTYQVQRGLTTAPSWWSVAIALSESQAWQGADEADGDYRLTVVARDAVCDSEDAPPAVATTVRVVSEARAIDLTIPGGFVETGSRLEFQPAMDARLSGAPSDFIARYGDFGLALTGFDGVALELSLWVGTDQGAGTLRVTGYTDDCEPVCNGSGCSGCGPLTPHALRSVTFALP